VPKKKLFRLFLLLWVKAFQAAFRLLFFGSLSNVQFGAGKLACSSLEIAQIDQSNVSDLSPGFVWLSLSEKFYLAKRNLRAEGRRISAAPKRTLFSQPSNGPTFLL